MGDATPPTPTSVASNCVLDDASPPPGFLPPPMSGSTDANLHVSRSQSVMSKGPRNSRFKETQSLFDNSISNVSGRSMDSNQVRRLRVAMHLQLQTTQELPNEFASGWSKLSLLCPVFKPELDSAFLSEQAEEMRKSSGSKTVVVVVIIYLLLAVGISLIAHVASGDVDVRNYEQAGFLLLSSVWIFLFFLVTSEKVARRRRALGLQNLSALIALYMVFSLCIGFDGSGLDGTAVSLASVLKSCIQILGLLIGWGSLPAPMSMKWFFFVIHFAVVAWGFRLVSTQSLHWYEYVSYILYLYGPSLLLFLSFRKVSFEQRMAYLNKYLKQHISKHDQKKIDRLSKEVKNVRIALDSEERAKNLLHENKAKLNALRADLEDPEIRSKIQQTHESLIRGYVQLAMSFTDCTEEKIAHLIDALGVLRTTSEAESRRLAKIMEELYDSFANIKEWEPVVACPSFENWKRHPDFPKEKLSQTSLPQWWRIVMQDFIPPSAERLGLVQEPLEWYLRRAQWAKTPFVYILKDAVKKFNEVSTPSELGLDPYKVMDEWNAKNPSKELTGLPFPTDTSLESDQLHMSEMMQQEYLEHGPNAGLQVGPIKDRTRAHAKVVEYRSEGMDKYPDQGYLEKYVCDWLRARIVFANPTALAVFFWYLLYRTPRMDVVASKNKLLNPPRQDTSCNIHLNVRFKVHGEEHTAEVQLLLENFLIAKDLEHKYYEFRRVNRLPEILAPVLEVPESEVKAQLAREAVENCVEKQEDNTKVQSLKCRAATPQSREVRQADDSGSEVQGNSGYSSPNHLATSPDDSGERGPVHCPDHLVLPIKVAREEEQNCCESPYAMTPGGSYVASL